MAEAAIGAPVECDLERRRGDTKDLRIRLTSSGSPIDVTGYTALLTVNTSKTPDPTVSPVVGSEVYQAVGTATSPGTDGIIRFDFADFDAFGSPAVPVPVGNYFYDVQIVDAASEKFTPLIGKFVVKQDITKT